MRSEIVLAAALSTLATACTWETDLPAAARDIRVDASRELVVTDDAALAHVPGFAHAYERLPLHEGSTLRWLRAWSGRLEAEGRADRAAMLEARVTCRWLRASPENACDDSCASCTHLVLRPEAAPFRLVAVANRTDLSVMPDRAADGGEGRLVFALTEGPATDPGSRALPLTVILEYAQHGSALAWTQRWHALGDAPADTFPDRLAAVVEPFVAAGALAQIRTADAWTGPMVLHQFAIDGGELVATNVRNTPDWTKVGPDELRAFAEANAPSIDDGTFVLPRGWWASSSLRGEPAPPFVSEVPKHEALLRQTCAGCHAQTERGFQIDPEAPAERRLSRFLSDPASPRDELRRRAEWMQLTLSRAR